VTQSFGFKSSTLGLPSFIDGIAPSFPQIQPQSYANLGAPVNLDNYIVPQTIWTDSVDFTKIRGRHSIGFGFYGRVGAASTAVTSPTPLFSFKLHRRLDPIPNRQRRVRVTVFASFPGWSGKRHRSDGFQQVPRPPISISSAGTSKTAGERRTNSPSIWELRYEIQTAPTEKAQRAGVFQLYRRKPDQLCRWL